MKAKYFVIVVLSIILGFVVYQMIRFEDAKVINIIQTTSNEYEENIIFFTREEFKNIYNKVSYDAMASKDYFKILQPKISDGVLEDIWENIYLKGVNLGVAMPGHFPVEFSMTFKEYLKWFELIGDMNSNVIRTYTILPPEFYDAFAYYNLNNKNKKLYLLQGIWAEEPDNNNYFNTDFLKTFQKEIRDVIDVINGNAVVKPKAGHANGVYVSDISKYVIGILLGREWEPNSVISTNNNNKISHFTGNFISINNGTPMEIWLAKMMDYTVQYETQKYMVQHPISFINWLPLDPMFHDYEFIENEKIREYDNDLVSVDFRKYNSTELFVPGIFATYHVYPYYPDYIFLEEKYKNTKNSRGNNDNFLGYLKDLKNNTGDMPLVIAEYGLPSSRGNSHFNPDGFNQGGQSETEQASLSSILTSDIFEAKCAGGLFFEWIDEWFKHNWLVMDFEQPAERRKLWHNMENPEQNFGILAIEARTKTVDGKLNEWKNIPEESNKYFITADADASYFYLAANLPYVDFSKNKLYIAIDTYDKKKGEHKLPFLNEEFSYGIEFLIEIESLKNAKILVDDKYSVFTNVIKNIVPVYASKYNNNGLFSEQLLITNREKETLKGEKIDSICINRSILKFGNSSKPENSNADGYWDNKTKTLEMRLTWHLLNVCDPSSRAVLDDVEGTPDIEYAKTQGFNIFYFITDKNNKLIDNKDRFINSNENTNPFLYTWETWEKPQYSQRLKPIYDTLKNLYKKLEIPAITTNNTAIKDKFSICDFYENKQGAISITFDDGDYNQYEYGLPVLKKYEIKANFGIVSSWLTEKPSLTAEEGSFSIKRLGLPQVMQIIREGNEISFHGNYHKYYNELSVEEITKDFKNSKKSLEKKLHVKIPVIQYPYSNSTEKVVKAAQNAGFTFGRTGEKLKNTNDNNIDFMQINSIAFYNSQKPSIKQLDSIIAINKNKWTIFLYHHIFPSDSKEYNLYKTHNVTNTYTVTPQDFAKQIRLIRNSDYWISTLSSVGKYIKERKNAVIKITEHENMIYLRIENTLNSDVYNHPLTVKYVTAHKKVKISNSAADGVYNASDNIIFFNVYPNQDVTIEILD